MSFPERDWKQLRALHERALQRFCTRILEECRSVVEQSAGTPHERFLQLYELLQDRNYDVARAFDDMRRSRAFERLLAMRSLGVVTDDDMAAFSDETRNSIELFEQS
jgi:hypothetical protein